jgi:hypothetical protein
LEGNLEVSFKPFVRLGQKSLPSGYVQDPATDLRSLKI